MYARSGGKRARHFYYIDDSARGAYPGSATGESSTYSRCVTLATAALKDSRNGTMSNVLLRMPKRSDSGILSLESKIHHSNFHGI